MPINVHILATCLNDALMEATTLVFRTLRVGFPDNPVTVWTNRLTPSQKSAVENATSLNGCAIVPLPSRIAHDHWIERLLFKSTTPFYVLDTDVVFWKALPQVADSATLSGRYEPAFREPWSKTSKVARLHTAVLYLDPLKIRAAVRDWAEVWHPSGFPFRPQMELVRQQFIPRGAGEPPFFYDTCAGLYQAIGGTPFTDEQNATFDHLHCGSYSDRISKALPGIEGVHRAVFENTEAARNLTAEQAVFYQGNPTP